MKEVGAERLLHRLAMAAQQEIDGLMRAFPDPLRKQARSIPVTLEPRPSPALQRDGLEPDVLGLFTGEAFPDRYESAHDLPAHIILFLRNIWDYARHDTAEYRKEVRRTYLHELGHFLGLDEDALVDRDLD